MWHDVNFSVDNPGYSAILWQSLQIDSTAESILDALIGSRKTRHGNSPTDFQRQGIAERVQAYVYRHIPIRLACMYGSLKVYGRGTEADLSDIMALRRLAALQIAVSRHYKPGLDIVVVREDVIEKLLGNASYHESRYQNTLLDLTLLFGLDFVRVINESALVKVKYIELDAYESVIIGNARVLRDAYLNGGLTNLDEIGWFGGINYLQWNHRINCVRREEPQKTWRQSLNDVALYFGNVLARRQFELMRFEIPVIPISFVPDKFGPWRLEYKIKEDKNSHKSLPPWGSFGVIDGAGWHQSSDDTQSHINLALWRGNLEHRIKVGVS